jgi:hypothetical protein
MSSMADGSQGGDGVQRFRVSPDAVHNALGDQIVLINVRTNEIYELNRTGARFWQLLSAGHDLARIRQLMLQEFEVDETVLDREIEGLLASLESAGLIVADD